MKFLNKMERKFGRYAIHDLPAIMIALYTAGYVLSIIAPDVLDYLTLDPAYILKGQIWRLITWLICPPGKLDIFTVIMLFFYFSIGRTLERTWGAFRFNIYIFSGMLFSAISAFALYAYYCAIGAYVYPGAIGSWYSTIYVNMSIFLAFAVTYPDMEVLLYFFIPIKMKWMGVLYGVLTAYTFWQYALPGRVVIIASLLNFAIYYMMIRGESTKYNARQYKRRQEFRQSAPKAAPKNAGPMHRCAVCGRTEQDDPNLEFRYCSKCDGAYEYCQDHLFRHAHKKV